MKYFIAIGFFISFFSYAQDNTQGVDPYLESIVTQFPNVRDLALSSQNTEAVFSAQSVMGDISALMVVNHENGKWSSPEIASFSGQYFDIEPFFSEDALTLYFASNRPLDISSSTPKDFDIWYVTRTKIGQPWSEPQNLGSPVNSDMDEFYPVITTSKNLYFTLDNKALGQLDDIYVSTFKNGSYSKPKRLGPAINSEGYEFNAYISPDESFIIFTGYNKPDGFGSGDLYISYKKDGQWSIAKNMGELINSDKMDYCPYVDVKSQTLYFTSKRNSIKQNFNMKLKIDAFQELFNRYENGSSRLYQTSISSFINQN